MSFRFSHDPFSMEFKSRSCYNSSTMKRTCETNTTQNSEDRQKLLEAIRLQEIEGNPLTPEEIEMFEMFEREGWSDEECREYIIKRFHEKRSKKSSIAHAAE